MCAGFFVLFPNFCAACLLFAQKVSLAFRFIAARIVLQGASVGNGEDWRRKGQQEKGKDYGEWE